MDGAFNMMNGQAQEQRKRRESGAAQNGSASTQKPETTSRKAPTKKALLKPRRAETLLEPANDPENEPPWQID